MSDLLVVGIGDMKASKNPDTIVTYALGSCIGICMFDKTKKIGALGHIMLPKVLDKNQKYNPYKYAESCVPKMLEALKELGCMKSNLVAKIVGGAQMFNAAPGSDIGSIGERNSTEVKRLLADENIPIIAEDIGENYGRTLYLYLETGKAEVKSFIKGTKEI